MVIVIIKSRNARVSPGTALAGAPWRLMGISARRDGRQHADADGQRQKSQQKKRHLAHGATSH